MLFEQSQPKVQARKTRQSLGFRVEELSRRIMLSDIPIVFPPPELPPPPPPTENGGTTP
jgi:hypothetical protein